MDLSLLSLTRRMYALDTLDTRFTTSSTTPLAASGQPRIDPAKESSHSLKGNGRLAEEGTGALPRGASPSRWGTLEFKIYYLVFLLAVPMMLKVGYEVSNESHPNYAKYEPLLSPGWILGRKVDNSDAQYADFRDHFPFMVLLLLTHPLLRAAYGYLYPISGTSSTGTAENSNKANGHFKISAESQADARLQQRTSFDIIYGVMLLTGLHGISVLKILLILYVNYSIAKGLPKERIVVATWVFNVGILFANELCSGYQFATIAKYLLPSTGVDEKSLGQTGQNWGAALDSYGGLVSRWEIMFNITVLRLISFNIDYAWSLGRSAGSPLEKKQSDPASLSERDRVSTPAPANSYNIRNYYAYALYSPLYIAGPILTFNDYLAQNRYSPRSITTQRTLLYGVRFLVALLTMEVMLHFIYAVAISKSSPNWSVYTPFQLSMLGYFNLHIIWLKLLLPWRFFRLWALMDGIDPPENMVRCMSNNYSALAFWRCWHRSFNRWNIRYIYIPLGGSGGPSTQGKYGKIRSVVNLLAVFTFVAVWHDINLKLLIWGWLITLFILPEVLAGIAFPKRKWEGRKEAYRIICGIGGVGNVLMMMAANLVGFAVGLDGLKGLVEGIVGSYSGLVFLASACAALFVGVQVMFEVREDERRHGIRL